MSDAKYPESFQVVAGRIPEGLTWSYKVSIRAGYLTHQWELIGPRGGIHVTARPEANPSRYGCEWFGGIEGHSPKPGEYDSEKPSHDHCWLIGGPCWHNGSSLQFSEQIAPYLPSQGQGMGKHHHDMVIGEMISRYHQWLPEAEALPG